MSDQDYEDKVKGGVPLFLFSSIKWCLSLFKVFFTVHGLFMSHLR